MYGSVLKVKSTNTFTYFQFVLGAQNTDSVESSSRSDSPTWESIEISKIRGKFFKQDSVMNGDLVRNGLGTDDSYERHVLLVEDNTICQKVCKQSIMKSGHTCEIAANGRIAVDMITKDPSVYDIIFMDLRMPIMDGFEATKRILEKNRNLPIVALSAEEDPFIENKFSDASMVAFIQKPVVH